MAKEIVLVADADPRSLRLVGMALRRAGFTVIPAATGEEAMRALAGALPQAMMLDAALPAPDGLALCRAARAEERLAGMVVLVLGTDAGPAARAQAIEAGSIDAAALDAVFSRRLKQKGFTILAEFSQANIPTVGLGLVAKNAFIRERQDALEGVLRGLSESVAFILSPKYKPVVLKTIMQHLRISDPATAEEGYQDLITGLEKKPFPSIEGLLNTQRLLKLRNPKLENIKVEELIDDRIIRRLEESGFIGRLHATYGIK